MPVPNYKQFTGELVRRAEGDALQPVGTSIPGDDRKGTDKRAWPKAGEPTSDNRDYVGAANPEGYIILHYRKVAVGEQTGYVITGQLYQWR